MVGVVSADTALLLPDFRAAERTFQLLARSRAARAAATGRDGDHPDVRARALRGHVRGAPRPERLRAPGARVPAEPRATRRSGRLLRVVFQGEERCASSRRRARSRPALAKDATIASGAASLLGPAPCPILKIRNLHRWHLIVKAREAGRARRGAWPRSRRRTSPAASGCSSTGIRWRCFKARASTLGRAERTSVAGVPNPSGLRRRASTGLSARSRTTGRLKPAVPGSELLRAASIFILLAASRQTPGSSESISVVPMISPRDFAAARLTSTFSSGPRAPRSGRERRRDRSGGRSTSAARMRTSCTVVEGLHDVREDLAVAGRCRAPRPRGRGSRDRRPRSRRRRRAGATSSGCGRASSTGPAPRCCGPRRAGAAGTERRSRGRRRSAASGRASSWPRSGRPSSSW